MSLLFSSTPIYLASTSPRRRALLEQIGLRFETLRFRSPPRADSALDETPRPEESALDYVQRLATAKAMHGERIIRWRHFPDYAVLGADTTLSFHGKIIGKPESREEAYEILSTLSGNTHEVLTAVALAFQGRVTQTLSISHVRFAPIPDKVLRAYVDTDEPMDKAGAYAIQGYAALFVEEISGSYSGVMGLPLFETGALLQAHFAERSLPSGSSRAAF